MVSTLEKYDNNEYIVRVNDRVISIKGRYFELMPDYILQEIVSHLDFYGIENISIIEGDSPLDK